jgi:hypothetical protein
MVRVAVMHVLDMTCNEAGRSIESNATRVPSGETGFIEIATTSGTLKSSKMFEVAPQVLRFSPPSGKVGDSIVLTGTGLIQTQVVGVGGLKVDLRLT